MNFITFTNNITEHYYIKKLNNYYNNKQFNLIMECLQSLDNNNFLTKLQKQEINWAYINNIRLKNIITKIITNRKCSKCINKTFFDLTFSYKINTNITKIYCSNRQDLYYKFQNSELIKIFYNNLINQSELIPEPLSPVNPYDGNQFTHLELSKCYMNFIIEGIQLPLELILFKKSNFCIKTMLYNFKTYFIRKSIASYLNDISDNCWYKIVWEFYFNIPFKNKICYKCLKNLENLREILNPTIQEYFYYINTPNYYKTTYIKMFKKICDHYKIEPHHKHPLKHMKLFKPPTFKFESTDITINFSSNSNYIFGSS